MENLTLEQIRPVLDELKQASFAEKDGVVIYANTAFKDMQIPEGTKTEQFLSVDIRRPYSETEECDGTVAGRDFQLNIRRLADCTLYLLNPKETEISAQVLTNTAKAIRTVLQQAFGAMDGLYRELEDAEDEKIAQLSASVLQSLYRIERIARNLNNTQMLFAGDRPLRPVKTEIVNYLNELFIKAESLLHCARITTQMQLPDKLFNGALDKELFEAAFWNLLSNAARHADEQTVSVSAAHKGNLLCLTVTDSGSGVSPQQLPELFARYKAPPEQTLLQPGVGLGLTVANEAAKRHGGSLLMTAAPQGRVSVTATFRLDLPSANEVHSPIMIEHGLGTGLTELSDILPREAFDPRGLL